MSRVWSAHACSLEIISGSNGLDQKNVCTPNLPKQKQLNEPIGLKIIINFKASEAINLVFFLWRGKLRKNNDQNEKKYLDQPKNVVLKLEKIKDLIDATENQIITLSKNVCKCAQSVVH